eukprot:438877_1
MRSTFVGRINIKKTKYVYIMLDRTMEDSRILHTWSIADRIDSYFTQNDDTYIDQNMQSVHSLNSKEKALLANSSTDSIKKQYIWKFRHTISYWIAISFIFGSLLLTTGSFFWIIKNSITSSDYYTLVDVAYLTGGIAYEFGSYLTYYSIINESNKNKLKRVYFIMPGKWTLGYKSSLTFLMGGTIAKFGSIIDFMQITYIKWDNIWIIYKICSFIGNTCFCIAGLMAMYLNECWKWKPYRLEWFVSWFNGIGGLLFFIAGIVALFNDFMVPWLYLFGSICYLIASIAALMMWKLQQFGYIYMPELNKKQQTYGVWKKKRNIVLYRDILFINLYVITAALAITSISYAVQCKRYSDWIKNYSLIAIGSLGVLLLGSVIHTEPEKPPFSYLLWFLRFYMTFYTVNLCIDAYHISGKECKHYGN